MSQKQKCIGYCLEYLASLGLSQYYNDKDFENVYRMHIGSQANPYTIGMTAADTIILNAKHLPDDSTND